MAGSPKNRMLLHKEEMTMAAGLSLFSDKQIGVPFAVLLFVGFNCFE